MDLGLHALGIGAGAHRAVIDAVASAAEHCGFATLWAGEHVVMVDRSESRYPYSDDGVIAVPAHADWLDPMIALGFAAAASSTSASRPVCCCCLSTIRWWWPSRPRAWTS